MGRGRSGEVLSWRKDIGGIRSQSTSGAVGDCVALANRWVQLSTSDASQGLC